MDFYGERRPILGRRHSSFCSTQHDHARLAQQGLLPPFYESMATASSDYSPRVRHLNQTIPSSSRTVAEDDDEDGINCSPCFDNPNLRRTVGALLLGQLLSLCLVGTGVSSQLLAQSGVSTPAAQSFSNYFLLCFVFGTSLSCRSEADGFVSVIRKRGWKYFLLALIDVEANFMIVYAYQFTNLTSLQLLDCSTIPTVMLLSWLFLSVRYLISHVVGVCICLLGIAFVIWADLLDGKGQVGGDKRLLGDLMCLAGSLFYAIGNISEELMVKSHSRIEYLGMIGVFGTLISGIQMAILEHQQLAEVNWTGTVIGSFALFAISMFVFYSLVTVLLEQTSALLFNLVTLSADFYSLLFSVFLFKDQFHWLYVASFMVVITGSFLYSLRPTQRRDADEPRRVCPCLFVFCCCSSCCFEDDSSSHGSLQVSPVTMPMNGMHSCPVHGPRPLFPQEGALVNGACNPYQVTRANGGFIS